MPGTPTPALFLAIPLIKGRTTRRACTFPLRFNDFDFWWGPPGAKSVKKLVVFADKFCQAIGLEDG
jgi:hypothetical protein